MTDERLEELAVLYNKLKGSIFLRLSRRTINSAVCVPLYTYVDQDIPNCYTLDKELTFTQFVNRCQHDF